VVPQSPLVGLSLRTLRQPAMKPVSPRGARNLHLIARAGYAARGIIYVIVGAMAALAALGQGGGTTDSRGALSTLMSAPFGKFLLAAIALGLLGYSAWRAVQALFDVDDHGASLKGLTIRAGLAVSSVTHLGLAFFAASIALGWGTGGRFGRQSGDGSSSQEWTAWLLSQPLGPWLVGAAGLAVAGTGVAHVVKGWRADFLRRFDMAPHERDFIAPVSRFGLIARGVAFVLIGAFLVTAAIQHDPSEARGLSGALQALQQQPSGWILLAILATGLVAFGAYSLIESVYRRVNVPV
jgi:hypothetical protein